MSSQGNQTVFAYIGTYTEREPHVQGKAVGIYVYHVDLRTGAFTLVHALPGVANPSFLAIDPHQRFLYAVNEVQEIDGQATGAVSAFAIDQASGALTYLNQQISHGSGPGHLCVDRTARFVLVANYGGGSISILPIRGDGSLGPATDAVQHVGSSVNPTRQREPHAHSITMDASNRYALVADLGLDKVFTYRVDLTNGKLVPNDPPSVSVQPGAGPRHLAFHPNGRFAYVINEIGSTLTAFGYDALRGTLHEIQTEPTLPSDYSGSSQTADVHVTPSGKFVYGSNRGHDSLVIFAIDAETGRMTFIGHQSTQGRTPRNFAIDPTGTYLFAANQDTDTIVTFRIDQERGTLTPTGHVAAAPTPVCIQFLVKST